MNVGQMIKRVICLLLCVVLIAAVISTSALAAEIVYSGTCGDNVAWRIDTNGVLTISGEGEMEESSWNVPPWNNYDNIIESVVIEDGVSSIANSAFSGQGNMKSVTIPESVTRIGTYAFSSCHGLPSITIPEGVVVIGDGAFYLCTNLVEVDIPSSVLSIENNAFGNCKNLVSVRISEGVAEIGYDAFSMCDNLLEIYFEGDAPYFESDHYADDGVTIYYPADYLNWQTVIERSAADITWRGLDADGDTEEVSREPMSGDELQAIIFSILRGIGIGVAGVAVLAGIVFSVSFMREKTDKKDREE